jgi:hypothetical protein
VSSVKTIVVRKGTARAHAPVLVAGHVAAAVALVAVIGPLAWEVVGGAADAVFVAGAAPAGRFWDSVAVLAVNAFQIAVATALALRERSRA